MELTTRERITLAILGGVGLTAMALLLFQRPPPLEITQGPSVRVQGAWDEALAHARLVDVNRATVEELARLPHVGPALATRIVASRTARGRFQTPEELRHVKGIGPKTYEALAGYVTTEAEVK